MTMRAPFLGRFDPPSTSVQATICMVCACAFFAAATNIVRTVGADIHPFEIVFFRNFFGLVVFLPWFLRKGFQPLNKDKLGLFVGRAFFAFLAMLCWFSALTLMPLAEATALSFTAPLFATIAAVIFLNEVVRLRRWTATIVGLLGAMVIIRPDLGAIEFAALLVFASTAAWSIGYIFVKFLVRTESPDVVVTYNMLFLIPVSLIPALFVWQWPTPEQAGYLAGLAAAATIGNYLTVRAFSLVDATAVLPYDFLRLPFTALIAFLAFAEVPGLWTWIGAAIIFSSTVYITHREARVKRVRVVAEAKSTEHGI